MFSWWSMQTRSITARGSTPTACPNRPTSLANATLGVLSSASLAVHVIGQGLAHSRGLITKHAVKQVDRLLGNRGIDVWSYFGIWVPQVLAARKEVMIAMDWARIGRILLRFRGLDARAGL